MPLEIVYDKIVIGSSLEAILFAYFNKLKIFYTRSLQPLHFEKIEDFGCGYIKKNIWDKYAFQLCLAGFIPFEQKIKIIHYVDKNKLYIVTCEDNVIYINFNKLYIFDDYNLLDLPISTKSTNEECLVIDTFKYKSKQLDLENIQRDDKFINQIIFDNKKIINCVSQVEKKNLEKLQEHIVKIKTENILFKHKLNLDHFDRKIYDLGKNIYDNFDNVEFIYHNASMIYNFYKKRSKIDYMKYLQLKMDLK